MVLTLSGGNDVIADKFDISLNAMTWAGRIGLLILPPLAYYVTYRICLGLQQHDREVLATAWRPASSSACPTAGSSRCTSRWPSRTSTATSQLDYAGWVVPKKMNRLGALKPTVRGFFRPVEEEPERPEIEAVEQREEITSGSQR